MKKTLILLMLLLSGCDSDRDVLCNQAIQLDSGNLEIINRQCMTIGGHTTGFITLQDKETKKKISYTMTYINGHVVFNLNQSDALSIEAQQQSESAAIGLMAANTAMMAASTSSGSSRR
jgi:hypothetical protein